MKAAKLSLLGLSVLIGAHSATAKTPSPDSGIVVPLESPGDWISTSDYPAIALRFEMTGITTFRLTVDLTGKPSRCDIVKSSGFDVLDMATCQRLMAKARFSPPHDRKGKAVDGTYSNRVRWILPSGSRLPVSERFASMLLSIDQTGKLTSCRVELHFPAETGTSAENPCKQALNSQLSTLGMELRGIFQGPSADVEIQLADVFTPALRERVLSPMPGYEQRALDIHRFTVNRDGKLGQCSYEEQRGSGLLAEDFCLEARRESFDPPFAAFDKDGVASGWHIMRVLLKTG